MRGQPVEQLRLHELRQRAAVGGEFDDRLPRIGRVAQRQRCEHQCRRPPLGATHERRDIGGAHRQAVGGEQALGLVDGERQGVAAHLGQLAHDPQARDGQVGVAPRGDHEPERRRCDAQQLGDVAQHARVGDLVEVVEDQEHRPVAPREGER